MASQVRASGSERGLDGRLSAAALERQSGCPPVFLALDVLAYVGVALRHQHTGGVRARGSMVVPTVDHDVRILVRNETFDGRHDLIWRQMQGARQMVLPIIRLGQHLKEKKLVATLDFQAQRFTRYGRAITHA